MKEACKDSPITCSSDPNIRIIIQQAPITYTLFVWSMVALNAMILYVSVYLTNRYLKKLGEPSLFSMACGVQYQYANNPKSLQQC